MNSHISALTQTLMIYLIMGVSFFGWGRVATYVLGVSKQTNRSDITLIWLGWAFTLFIFQLLHFFFPLTVYVAAPIFIIGFACSIPQIVNAFRRFPQKYSNLMRTVGILIILLAVACWIASRSMLSPTCYDSGLYHFNAIRWINSFPIVPGLGNLHGRLAFNQSFYTYVAALNFYPFFGHGYSVANSFLLLLAIATFVSYLRPILKKPSLLAESHPFQYASVLFSFPILGYLALSSNGVMSPSPDLTSTLLQLIMIVMLANGIAEWINGQRDQNYRAMVLVVLSATAITIKLSNLAFSAVIFGFALVYTWQTSRPHIKGVFHILLPATMLILVWGLRGYILSGAPLYPSTIGYMPMEWAMPIEQIVNEANWVYSWARLPGTHWENVLGSWTWLHPWLLRISKDYMTDVVYPLMYTAIFCIIAMVIGRLKKVRRSHYLEWAILLPSIIAMIYWFFTAPDPRFANAIFFLASLFSILLFLSSIRGIIRAPMFITMICIVFLVGNVHFFSFTFRHIRLIKWVSTSGWHAVKKVPLNRKVTSSGLTVYTPKTGDQCWDSPLPSAPFFNDRLRLRNPANMSSGFTVIEQEKH